MKTRVVPSVLNVGVHSGSFLCFHFKEGPFAVVVQGQWPPIIFDLKETSGSPDGQIWVDNPRVESVAFLVIKKCACCWLFKDVVDGDPTVRGDIWAISSGVSRKWHHFGLFVW